MEGLECGEVRTGKTFEGHTFRMAVSRLISKYSLKGLTVVADAGMLSQDNLTFLKQTGLKFIVGARIRNLPAELTCKVLSHDFSLKNPLPLETDGSRLLVSFDPDRAKKDRHERENLVIKLKKRLKEKRVMVRKSKYLKWEDSLGRVVFDEGKQADDAKFDGLKGYLTNSTVDELPDSQVITRYRDLWQVERAFRLSKSDLSERPIFHRLERRIGSHLLLCFVSLLVLKETERIFKTGGYSITRALELLGKVVEGRVKVSQIELPTESDLDLSTKSLLELFEGH